MPAGTEDLLQRVGADQRVQPPIKGLRVRGQRLVCTNLRDVPEPFAGESQEDLAFPAARPLLSPGSSRRSAMNPARSAAFVERASMAMPLRIHRPMRPISNSANVARMLENILPMGHAWDLRSPGRQHPCTAGAADIGSLHERHAGYPPARRPGGAQENP